MSDETPKECEHGIKVGPGGFNCVQCKTRDESPSLAHPMQGTTERPVPDVELEQFIAAAESANPNEGIPIRADVMVWLCKNFRETRSACADLVSAAGEERKGASGTKVDDAIWEGLLDKARKVLPA